VYAGVRFLLRIRRLKLYGTRIWLVLNLLNWELLYQTLVHRYMLYRHLVHWLWHMHQHWLRVFRRRRVHGKFWVFVHEIMVTARRRCDPASMLHLRLWRSHMFALRCEIALVCRVKGRNRLGRLGRCGSQSPSLTHAD
jgi:hypothetical protein